MKFKLVLFFTFVHLPFTLLAQMSLTEIRYTFMDIQALRYYPFQTEADSVIQQIKERKGTKPYSQYDVYHKTDIDLQINKEYLDNLDNPIIRLYRPLLEQARPLKENSRNVALSTLLYEDYFTCYSDNANDKKGFLLRASQSRSLYRIAGEQNIKTLLNDVLIDIDLYKKKNEVLARTLKGPLSEEAASLYRYFLSGQKTENGELWQEIVFFPNRPSEAGFAGYLYVTADGRNQLRKAVFSVNSLANPNSLIENMLFVQYFDTKENIAVPVKKRSYYALGDEIKGHFLLTWSSFYSDFSYPETLEKKVFDVRQEQDYLSKEETFWEDHRPEPLSAAGEQIDRSIETASRTRAFRNTENFLYLLLTNHWPIGGKDGFFEWGSVTQAASHNDREGWRFKIKGNTTPQLNKHLLLGGYVAYGLEDKKFKYRGDIIYSFSPKEKSVWEYPKSFLSFTYVEDLNIPGEDLLTSDRDDFFSSLSHSAFKTLTRQKIGTIAWEKEMTNRFSFKVQGKYLSDNPNDVMQYKDFIASEVIFSIRYAPNEKTFQRREKRVYFQEGDIELNLQHRIGLKGIFGSEHNYHITDGSIFRRQHLPYNIGLVDMELSAGKIWNKIPSPLLFIPNGNQGYIFKDKKFNLLNYYEFVTDNFVAGNVNFQFNWSPIRLFAPKNKIQTSIGGRMIYGPLSDNNLVSQSGLFVTQALGQKPYIEVNAGLSNILKIFRIEYVRRLTYLDTRDKINKGSVFIAIDLRF
jgi:hypothetical protein